MSNRTVHTEYNDKFFDTQNVEIVEIIMSIKGTCFCDAIAELAINKTQLPCTIAN